MTADPRARSADGTNVTAQLVGVLLAPAATLAGLQLAYQYVPHDCRAGSAVLGHIIHGGALLLCLAGAFIAWSEWQRYGGDWPEEEAGPIGRSRLLGAVGVLISLLSALVVVAQWLPTFFLSPCQ
jgi:membrane protease YdiL (CAAX protease family)